ncbi:cupin domain-containing protein [uncultured Pigmentiphaga sp.]|uniref:cupin domain-containing protein n=1 Tax=uncultured Pigmentiphaga sp. TaxID=340361 RepID=UPI00262EA682|nr:cupin domain-containing protein [uncultured Pigmentiphaga sp.]
MKRMMGGLAAWVLAAGVAVAAESPGVQVQTLMESSASWDGRAYEAYPPGPPLLTVLRITIPPHSALPWHTHPIPNAAYVLSGELTVEKQGTGETRWLKQGDVLPEMVGEYHRGVTGDQGVVLIVFYAGSRGVPLSQQ